MPSRSEETQSNQTEMQNAPLPIGRWRRWQFLFLALFGVLCSVSFLVDNTVLRLVGARPISRSEDVAGLVSDYGDWPFLMLAALSFLLWAIWKKRSGMVRLVATMMIASTLAGMVANTLRLTTGRTRPSMTEVAPGWYGLHHKDGYLFGDNKFNSFPSGHTATAFGFFAVLAFRKKTGTFLWLIPPVVMGVSRILIEAHHLSDVCFGAWFGLLAAWWVGTWRWPWNRFSAPSK